MEIGHCSKNRVFVSAKIVIAMIVVTTLTVVYAVTTFAQEDVIEIVNQHGERVDNAQLMENPVELEDPTDANEATLLKSDRGVLTYTDSDGNEKQVDLDRAQSVVIQQSTQSVNNNGQQETKIVKKAIVVDADGQQHEIDISKNGEEGLDLPSMPGAMLNGFPTMFGAKQNVNKYTIGVHCVKVSPAMQAQLNLGEGTGLVVDAIGQGSPAEAASLQKHDILLFADDQELMTQDDLMRVIQKVGEAESELSLTVMRGGKELGVDVSPIERTAKQLQVGMPERLGGFDFGRLRMGFADGDFDPFGGGDFDNRMDIMRQRMQEMQQRMRARFEADE